MGQPMLTAALDLAIAVLLGIVTAAVTSAAEIGNRAVKLSVVGVVIAIAVVVFQRAALRINFTGSMPRFTPPDGTGSKR